MEVSDQHHAAATLLLMKELQVCCEVRLVFILFSFVVFICRHKFIAGWVSCWASDLVWFGEEKYVVPTKNRTSIYQSSILCGSVPT
jgi:hypothetical protein